MLTRRLPTNRVPTSPKAMFVEEFPELAAEHPGLVARLDGRIDHRLAETLARLTGMSRGFWLALQASVDAHVLVRRVSGAHPLPDGPGTIE